MLLAAAASSALATHSIGIFEDQAGLDCEIADPGGATLKTIYIVHLNELYGAIGSGGFRGVTPGILRAIIRDATP